MFKMNVNGKEYTVKFGYLALSKSNSLLEVTRVQDKITEKKNYEKEKEAEEENRRNFPEYDYEETDTAENNKENIELICEIMKIIPKLLLAGLQKFHKDEFKVDYDLPEDIKEKENKVVELLDDYMDDENSLDIMDLFSGLVDELFNNGFLSKKSEKLEAAMTEQNATVTPSDHKQSEN